MNYYTLFIQDDEGIWHDEFDSELKAECRSEVGCGCCVPPGSKVKIVSTGGTYAGLRGALDILNGVSA